MRWWAALLAVMVLNVSSAAQTRSGVVAQLDVRGPIDSRAMGDEMESWFARRDAQREAMALVVIDSERARADIVGRVAEAINRCPVPVTVYVESGKSVAPGVLALMLAADRAAVGRGARIAGDQDWSLPTLCEPVESGWRGRYEALCQKFVENRRLPALALDLMCRPLGNVYLQRGLEGASLVRERNDAEARSLVTWKGETDWRVDLDPQTLIILKMADEADGVGPVLRQGGIRAFKRERTEVRSGLGDARAEAGRLREELRVRLVRMERALSDLKKAKPHEREEQITALSAQVSESQSLSTRLGELMSAFPELTRMAPTWGATVVDDPAEHQKRWAREVSDLGDGVDEVRVELEAMDEP